MTNHQQRIVGCLMALSAYCLLPTAYCFATSDAEAFAAMQRLMDTGAYARAYDAGTQFLHDYPESAWRTEAEFRQGVCAFQLSRWAAARDTFQRLRARRAPPGSSASSAVDDAVPFYLAEIAYREGRYAEAMNHYQAVIAAPRSSSYKPLAQVGLGWTYYQQGRCAESFAAFDSLRKNPASPLAGATLFALGDCAQRLGRVDDAMQALRQLLSQDPQNAWADDAALRLGELLIARGREGEARALFDAMLRTYPAGRLAGAFHVQAGQLALKTGDTDAAHAHFQDAAAHADTSPYFVSALVGLGDVAFERGQFDEAARQYARVLLASPHGPYAAYALFQQAQALLNGGHPAKARYLYQQLVDTVPESRLIEESMFRLGQAWDVEGRTAQAIAQYARLLSRSPQSPWAQHAQLAWAAALARTDHRGEAQAMCSQLIRQSTTPDIRGLATVQYAQTLATEGRQPEAITLLQELLRQSLQPAVQAEAQLALARWAIEAHQWKSADEALAATARLQLSRDAEAECLFWRGWVALQRGEMNQAGQYWDTLMTRHPQHARAAESRAWRLFAAMKSRDVRAALDLLDRWQLALPRDAWEQTGRQFAGRLREEGLADAAIQVLTYLIPHLPERARPAWWCALGEAYEEAHRADLAIAVYEQAAGSVPPWSARGALAAARLLEEAGELRTAARFYQQVSVTQSPEAAVAMERLQALQSHQ